MKKKTFLHLALALTALLVVFAFTPSIVAEAVTKESKENLLQERKVLDPGNDRRTEVWAPIDFPHQSIGQTVTPAEKPPTTRVGTGFVVGINTFVTNKHVVENFKYAKPFNKNGRGYAWFCPGKNAYGLPFGKFKVIDYKTSPNADLAVVTVSKQNDRPSSRQLGNVVKAFKLKKFDKSDQKILIPGYPYEVGGTKAKTQYEHVNYLEESNYIDLETPRLLYDIDTSKGQSGSPLIKMPTLEVVGVHARSFGTQEGLMRNAGETMNTNNYYFIIQRVYEENYKALWGQYR